MLTAQEINATQGTRLDERAPWETYSEELDLQMDDQLASAVAAYAECRYEEDSKNTQMQEELHRQQELSDVTAKEYQWLRPEDYADIEQRIGRVMHSSVFIALLRKVGVKCWYGEHPHADKITLLVAAADGVEAPEVACWVQLGFMPELSIMRFDEHDVPLDERRRGWRTCLLQLILKGFVTEQKANEVFGSPKQSDAFHRYNSTLLSFRNAGSRLSE